MANMRRNCDCFLVVALLTVSLIPSTLSETGNSIESDEAPVKAKASNIIEKLREQIKMKEAELENAEKINKNFERMIQLVNIMGQVDTFLTDRTRMVLKKLAMLADDADGAKTKSGPQYNIKF